VSQGALANYQPTATLYLWDLSQQYELSPAYDVLRSGQALGFQQMRVGEQEADLFAQHIDRPFLRQQRDEVRK
jgi:hypothetical protein